jgi:hypothetical protein
MFEPAPEPAGDLVRSAATVGAAATGGTLVATVAAARQNTIDNDARL